jgi:hypothetical protein
VSLAERALAETISALMELAIMVCPELANAAVFS